MKAEITKVNGGFEITLHTGDFTPHHIPILQSFREKGLKEVFEVLRRFYGDNSGEKKEE